VQLLFGNDEGTEFCEFIVEATKPLAVGDKVEDVSVPRRFELRGVELKAFAQLCELARPELKRRGGSKR
jgi:hypothetical protein